MKLKATTILAIGLFISTFAYSQDIHFTNYSYSPLYLSPAKTGSFLGTYRFGVNARTQFNSFITEPYQTLMGYAEMNIAAGLKPHHWIGAGINLFSDSAGDLSYKTTGAHLSVAYHYALDPKYKTIVSLGLQFGMTQRNIDATNFASSNELGNSLGPLSGGGSALDPDRQLLDQFNPSINDFNVGISLQRQTSKKAHIDLGFAVTHLGQDDFTFSNSSFQNQVKRRYNAYVEYRVQSSRQLVIRPKIVYSRMFNFQNLFGQFNLEYKPDRKSPTIIKGGLGFRNNDALQFLAGTFYKGWDVGIAYDLTVSSASEFTNGFGGLEIGIKKILVANKKPESDPVILCPKF